MGNIIGIENDGEALIAAYKYDDRGNHSIEYFNNTDLERQIANLNPFRWKGFYYDVETGYYNISSRYYDPETATFLDVVTPEAMLSAASSIGGLNRDAITFGNFIAITPNGFDISTMDDLAVDMSYDPDAGRPWWVVHMNTILAVAELLYGTILCLVGAEPLGLIFIELGIVGLLPPALQQVMNGLGTIWTGMREATYQSSHNS